jgi:hypothetical protein
MSGERGPGPDAHPGPFYSDFGPTDGPLIQGDAPSVIGVLAHPDAAPGHVGVAYCKGFIRHRDRSVAVWGLVVHREVLPGLWVCVARRWWTGWNVRRSEKRVERGLSLITRSCGDLNYQSAPVMMSRSALGEAAPGSMSDPTLAGGGRAGPVRRLATMSVMKRIGLAVAMLGLMAGAMGQARAGVVTSLNSIDTGDPMYYRWGPTQQYDATQFHVTTSGNYTIRTFDVFSDLFLEIYDDTFSPSQTSYNTTGLLAGVDVDWYQYTEGLTNSFTGPSHSGEIVRDLALTSGKTYYAVVSTLGPNYGYGWGYGPYQLQIDGGANTASFGPTAVATPEPATLISAAMAGLVGLGAARRKRKAKASA